jgi:hypothetical protein
MIIIQKVDIKDNNITYQKYHDVRGRYLISRFLRILIIFGEK